MYCWAHNVPLYWQGEGILHQNAYQIESELENTTWPVYKSSLRAIVIFVDILTIFSWKKYSDDIKGQL